MKEYVSKWNASQKEVDANTQQQDELTEVEVPGKLKASLNEVNADKASWTPMVSLSFLCL